MTALPNITTPEALAERMGWSPRRVRKTAKALGACRLMGNRMALTDDDVKAIMEASKPCPSPSIDAGKSGITGGPLPGGSYEALRRQRARKLPSALPPLKKPDIGKVISMDRHRS